MEELDRGPLESLSRVLWGFAGERIVSAAARTGLLREMSGDPRTPAELAASARLDPSATGKVVRALAALGLAEASSGERYRLLPALAPRFAGGDEDLTAYVAHSDELNDGWGRTLEGWLRTGSQPRRARDQEGLRRFGAAMRAMAGVLAPQVARALGLEGVRSVLDLGGGLGRWAEVFCDVAPGIERYTILDHPGVVELGGELLGGRGLEDRVELRGGDYHEADLGEGAYDLVLLSNVLHQELADAAAALVRRAASALAPGGRLAVVDFRIDEARRQVVQGALFAVNMRSFGDTYPEPTIRGWLEAAGLEAEPARPIAPDHWLIVGRRAAAAAP